MKELALVVACLLFPWTMVHGEDRHHEEWRHHDSGKHHAASVPEIGTGAAASGLALVAGGFLLIADRRRKQAA